MTWNLFKHPEVFSGEVVLIFFVSPGRNPAENICSILLKGSMHKGHLLLEQGYFKHSSILKLLRGGYQLQHANGGLLHHFLHCFYFIYSWNLYAFHLAKLSLKIWKFWKFENIAPTLKWDAICRYQYYLLSQ